jgi:mono/diheme cytochrome c family protein
MIPPEELLASKLPFRGEQSLTNCRLGKDEELSASTGAGKVGSGFQEGDTLNGQECGDCHGLDGRTPTDEGRWMCPRAADLTASSVQRFSDKELFWIVKNGVHFSGMPAFAKVETDEHIWNLVEYLQTLRSNSTGAAQKLR